MRVSYRRSGGNKNYWSIRWSDMPLDEPMRNFDAYPLKFAEFALNKSSGRRILEAGCGAGRILRHYHERGFDICGFDFIEAPISKLRKVDPSIQVEVGDVTDIPFGDNEFDLVLEFGLLHNLENGLEAAVSESKRVLKTGGILCASFRADNLQNYVIDWMADRKIKALEHDAKNFHKMNLKRSEFVALLTNAGFEVEDIFPVSNMPFLFKFKIFRGRKSKVFSEPDSRVSGYSLSLLGSLIHAAMMYFFPNQFCNVYVAIARK